MAPPRRIVTFLALVVAALSSSGCVESAPRAADIVAAEHAFGIFARYIAGDRLDVDADGWHHDADEPVHLRGARIALVGPELPDNARTAWQRLGAHERPALRDVTSGIELIADDGHGHGAAHEVWLDPVRAAHLVSNIAHALGSTDRPHMAHYEERAADLRSTLEALDATFLHGLRQCDTRHIVVAQGAYAYTAHRYNLYQHEVPRLAAPAEVDAPTEATLADLKQRFSLTHVYAPAPVDAPAWEPFTARTGLGVLPLDPIEAASPDGATYFGRMAANLGSLRTGNGCV